MGGLEQKYENVENLISQSKFKEAAYIAIEILKNKEIYPKIYDKFMVILNRISSEEKQLKIKLDIYLKSYNYLKQRDKDKIQLEIIKIFKLQPSKQVKDNMKKISELKDFELDFQMQKLYDNKLIEENPIDYSKLFENFDEIIEKIKYLISKIHIQSLKNSLIYKLNECYVEKGKKAIEQLITLTDIDEIKGYLDKLNHILLALKEINDSKESIKFILSLISTGESYLLMIEGKKLIEKGKYGEAYNKFISIKTERDLFQIENFEITCIKAIGESFEKNEDYDKAFEIFKKNNKFKFDEIRVEIKRYFKEANTYLEEKKFYEAIKSYVKMYKAREKLSNTQLIENIFTNCVDYFLTALTSFCKNFLEEKDKSKILEYEKKIKDIYEDINDELMKKNIFEILNFIKDIKTLGKESILKEKIMNENKINSNLPEILQRIYMEILLYILYSNNEKEDMIKILNIIIKYAEENLYISRDDLIKLRTLFSLEKSKENKKILVVVSKLYYILSKKGIEFEKNILIIIGNAIISINKEKKLKKDSYNEEEFNEIMINLFLSLEKLIKEQDYKLNNVEKIYNLILDSNIKNIKLCDVLLNGYYYFYQKNITFSNKTINNLLSILLEREKNEKLLDIILLTFKKNKEIYQEYIPKFFKLILKYPQKEDDIISIIISTKIPDDILLKQEFHRVIDLYLNKSDNNSIFLIIEKIPLSYRTSKMMEKYSLYEERKKKDENSTIRSLNVLNPEFNKRNLRLREYYNLIECGISLDKEKLNDIENNLNLNGFYDLLIVLLEKQDYLIEKLNLSIISKFFNQKNYKIFEIISNKKIIWKEKHLMTIIKVFGKNNEEEKKLAIDFIESIKKYQSLPKIIEQNVDFEKKFKEIQKQDALEKDRLIQLLEDFKKIKYFSSKYFKTMNKIIINFFNDSNKKDEDKKNISKKIIKLLVSTCFNISEDILESCYKNISINDFIQSYSEIISNMKIKFILKKVIFDKISELLNNSDNEIKTAIIKQMKYFIDWEIMPSDLIKILYKNISKNEDGKFTDMSKEIIYIFGVICTNFEHNKIPKEFFNDFRTTELYNLIKKELPTIKENYIFYIYSLLIFYGKTKIESKSYYTFPRDIIIENIKERLKNKKTIGIFEESFNYFEKYHKFEILSPKRDKYIRKLLFNKKININDISRILIGKCTEEDRIEKIEGDIINGKIFGFGKMHYTNGDYYIGFFLNNKKEGEGEFFENNNPNGIKQIWKEGKLLED